MMHAIMSIILLIAFTIAFVITIIFTTVPLWLTALTTLSWLIISIVLVMATFLSIETYVADKKYKNNL